MSNIKYKRRHVNDYNFRLKDGSKFDPFFTEYTDDQWLIVQMQIDANTKERERQEAKADRDFKLALIFLSCLGVLSISFFVAVLTSSYLAVSSIQKQHIEQEYK